MTEAKRALKSCGVISRHLNDMILLSSTLEKKSISQETKTKYNKKPNIAKSLSPDKVRSPPRPISPPNLNEKKKIIPKNSTPEEIVSFGIEDSSILAQRLDTNFDYVETENDEESIKKLVINSWRSYAKERNIQKIGKKIALFSSSEKIKLTSIFKWKKFVLESKEFKKRSQSMRKTQFKPSYELDRVQFVSSFQKFDEQLKCLKNEYRIAKKSRKNYEFKQNFLSPKFAMEKICLDKKEIPEVLLKQTTKKQDLAFRKKSIDNLKSEKSMTPKKIQNPAHLTKSIIQKASEENNNWFEPYLQKKALEVEEHDLLASKEKIYHIKRCFNRWKSQYKFTINAYKNYYLKRIFKGWTHILQSKIRKANILFLKKFFNSWNLLYRTQNSKCKVCYLKKSIKSWVKFKEFSKNQYKQYYLKKHFFKWIDFMQLKANKLLANINATSFYQQNLLSRTFKALYPKEYTVKEIMACNHWHSRLKIHYFYLFKKAYLKSKSIKMIQRIGENNIRKVIRKWKISSDLYLQKIKEMDYYYLKELAHNCFDAWSEWVLQEKIVRTLKKQRIFRAWKYTANYLLKEFPNKWKLHSLKRKAFTELKNYYIKKKTALKGMKWRKENEIVHNEVTKKIVLASFLQNLVLKKQ